MPRRSGKSRAKFTVADKRALNKVKRAVNAQEVKVISTAFTADPNSSGSVVALMPIAQGPDSNEREGDMVTLHSFKARGILTLHASATNTHVRMMVVRDNFGGTTIPAITDMFSSATQFIANKLPFGDTQSQDRFTVIWDRFVILDAGAHGLTQTVKVSKKLAKKNVNFTGAASSDEGQNHLYLFIGSSEATNDPVVNIGCHVNYTDN